MIRDCLIIKLRAEFNNHIRPIKINSQCEFCGSCDDLHLHHIDTFSNLLDETLEDLNINVYSENFTDSEVENINNIMLGKQLRSKLATLCKNCHKEVHKDGYINARDRIKPKKPKTVSLADIEVLEEYLEDCVNNNVEFLSLKDREPLIKRIGLVDEKHSNFKKNKITYVKNIETLNSHLTSLGLDYQIVQLPQGTTRNKKRYRAIWYIEDNKIKKNNGVDDKLVHDINLLINWFDTNWDKKRARVNDVRDFLDISVRSWQKVLDSKMLKDYMKKNRITKTTIKGLGKSLYFKKY